MYDYKAKLVRVIDGDTLVLMVDLGFGVKMKHHIRLARINTPEVRGEERDAGMRAKEYVEDVLHGVQELIITTNKDKKGSFGRYIAEVTFPKDGENKNLGDLLLEKGYAEEYE